MQVGCLLLGTFTALFTEPHPSLRSLVDLYKAEAVGDTPCFVCYATSLVSLAGSNNSSCHLFDYSDNDASVSSISHTDWIVVLALTPTHCDLRIALWRGNVYVLGAIGLLSVGQWVFGLRGEPGGYMGSFQL